MRSILIALFIWIMAAASAHAQVTATFYNHDLGNDFPHVFFTLDGTLSDGTPINTNYGFSAKSLTPMVLVKSVKGKVRTENEKYVSISTPRLQVLLDDAGYARLMGVVEDWRTRRYRLNSQNCVHFGAEALRAVGLRTNPDSDHFKRPRAFLFEVVDLNPSVTVLNPRTGDEPPERADREAKAHQKSAQ